MCWNMDCLLLTHLTQFAYLGKVNFCVIGVVIRAIPHFGSLMSFQVFVALYFALYPTYRHSCFAHWILLNFLVCGNDGRG